MLAQIITIMLGQIQLFPLREKLQQGFGSVAWVEIGEIKFFLVIYGELLAAFDNHYIRLRHRYG